MAPQTSQSAHPEIEIRSGEHVRCFPLEGRIVLGRGEEADLRLDDHRVSRAHCRLEPVTGGVKITDLGSSNGTRVNGRDISQVVLRSGDVATVGSVEIRLTADVPAGAKTPPPVPRATPPTPRPTPTAPPPVPKAAASSGPPPVPEQRAVPEAPTTPPRPAPAPQAPPPPRASEPEVAAEEPASPRRTTPPAVEVAPRKRRQVKELPSAPTRRPAPAAAASTEPVSNRAPSTNYLPLVIVGIVVVALIAIVMGLGGEDEAASAAGLERDAQALQSEGDFPGAVAKLQRLQERYPDTPAAKRTAELVVTLEKRIEQRREGLAALARTLGDPELSTFSLMQGRLRDIGARYAPGVTREDVAAKVAEAQRSFDQRSSTFVAGVRAEALALMQSRAFGPALDTIARAETSGRVFGSAREKLQGARDLVERAARRRFGDLVVELKRSSKKDALTRLKVALPQFQGTVHEGEVRARRALLEAEIARAAEIPAVAAQGVEDEPAPPPPPDLLESLSRAEGLIGRRRFAASIPALEEVLKHVVDRNEQARLERRLARVRGMASAVDAVIAKVKSQPGAFRGIRVGRTVKGNVVDATRDRVTVSLGPGAKVVWDWARLTPERFERLVIRSGLEGPPSAEAATVLLDMGAPEAALRIIARRFDKEPSLRRRMSELVVEARGMTEIPIGGFFVHDGRMLTVEERDEAVLIARLDDLEAQVASAQPGTWMNAADQLRAVGVRGEERLKTALRGRLDGFAKHLEALPALQKKRLASLRQLLFAELQKRRGAALSLIYDSKRYPYPYAPNQKEVQAEVDELVAKVREVWATPSKRLIGTDDQLQALHQDASAVATALEALGETVDGPSRLLKLVDDKIDMRHYDGGKSVVDHWKSVQAHNDDLLKTEAMTQPERDCYTATNEYRVMMGLKAVMGHEALLKAARGHSQEMKDKGYFSHTSPTRGRESPGKRAKLAGWGGSVSENIARGRNDGHAVVRQWCGSSGHHRNILGKRWTHLGAGKSKDGAYWTQNFGSGRSKPPKRRGK